MSIPLRKMKAYCLPRIFFLPYHHQHHLLRNKKEKIFKKK